MREFYRPLPDRWKELYKPRARNFQLWLAFIAFIGFIATFFFTYREGRWYVIDNMISSLPGIWQTVFMILGILITIVWAYTIISFFTVAVNSLRKQRIKFDDQLNLSKQQGLYRIDLHFETTDQTIIEHVNQIMRLANVSGENKNREYQAHTTEVNPDVNV